MIVQDVVTRVRRVFGDEAAVQVTDADIIRWINDGQIEIVKNNDAALQKTSFINLVSDQSSYTLPADMMILRSLRYKFSDMLSYRVLKYRNMQQFDETLDGWDGTEYTTGAPQYFTMYEDKAILFPIPNQSVTSGVKVLYNQKPTDVTVLGDSLSLPLIYHNTIVTYAMWQASLMDEDRDPAQMYKLDFQNDMNTLQENETSDPNSTYPIITVMEGDL